MKQRTEEWFSARLGRVTASRIKDVMAKTKTGVSASRQNYMIELLCERITGERAESYTNSFMEWGIEMEPLARGAYEAETGQLVKEVGLVPYPATENPGASPDGLLEDGGLIEIKCPATKTHIETILSEKIKREYILQMQFQMACTGADYCDFVSYDPRLPKNKLWIKRVERDDEMIADIEKEVKAFLDELDKLEEKFGG